MEFSDGFRSKRRFAQDTKLSKKKQKIVSMKKAVFARQRFRGKNLFHVLRRFLGFALRFPFLVDFPVLLSRLCFFWEGQFYEKTRKGE